MKRKSRKPRSPKKCQHSHSTDQPQLTRKWLRFAHDCAKLEPWQYRRLAKYLPKVLGWAGRFKQPDVEEAAVSALVTAIVTYRRERPQIGSESKPRKQGTWIQTKVRFAIRNTIAEFSVDDVRDAVVEFRSKFGHWPNVKQLRKLSGIGPRQILNVWSQVAADFGISLNEDPILPALSDAQANAHSTQKAPCNSITCRQVNRILVMLPPREACLLLLFDVCEYSEKEIVQFLNRTRREYELHGDVDLVLETLDEFTRAESTGLLCPWDDTLLGQVGLGFLRGVLHRARKQFERLYEANFGIPN